MTVGQIGRGWDKGHPRVNLEGKDPKGVSTGPTFRRFCLGGRWETGERRYDPLYSEGFGCETYRTDILGFKPRTRSDSGTHS